MKYIADLHVHSKYSIATAKNLDLENVYISAQKKGVSVVGTGDFTHPAWIAELKEKLIPAESGLYRLKKSIEDRCDREVPRSCRKSIRFILTTEISNIYKKHEKTRKNHNLVLAPDFNVAEGINATLDKIGNIKSDGRPILGLDARNLLEIVLEASEKAILIPAHIWTPWFSLLGSKSGFDSVKACFEDLTPHIFAVETGLSSDPGMNWRVSDLDNMTLISNSDAHSPMKLGREANRFNTDMSYEAIREALMKGDLDAFEGTLEFFPEEGKYHLDGHKKCGVRFTPIQTIEKKGICPVCNKPLTVGVLYRVEALADKPVGRKSPKARPYQHVVALVDILSQVLNVGPQSKKVQAAYEETIAILGDEFSILLDHSSENIEKKSKIPLLGEAIRRTRAGRIELNGGYDGEFGTIRLFREDEKRQLMGQQSLFNQADSEKIEKKKEAVSVPPPTRAVPFRKKTKPVSDRDNEKDLLSRLNPAQQRSVYHDDTPLIIAAGPGTGKTLTITGRMVHLIKDKKVPPHQILAVTFTHKAAEEMKRRLERYLPQSKTLSEKIAWPQVATFHAFCMDFLRKKRPENPPMVLDESDQEKVMGDAIAVVKKVVKKEDPSFSLPSATIGRMIMSAKQKLQTPETMPIGQISGKGPQIDEKIKKIAVAYQNLLQLLGVCDYEDLIIETVALLKEEAEKNALADPRFRYVFVDEYQDINEGQYHLLRAIVSPNGTGLCVIGDPNQAIYGFRGSNVRFFQRFSADFKAAKRIDLTQNYRSTQTIVNASVQMIGRGQSEKLIPKETLFSKTKRGKAIGLIKCRSEQAEAAAIGRRIVALIGGRGYHDIDLRRAEAEPDGLALGFDDIAVVYRTGRQGEKIADVFQKMGIPSQMVVRRRQSHHQKIRQLISLLTVLEGKPVYQDIEAIRDLFKACPTKKTMTAFKHWGLHRQFNPSVALEKVRLTSVHTITRPQQLRLEGMVRQLRERQKELRPLSVVDKVRALVEDLDIVSSYKKEPGIEAVVNQILERAGRFDGRADQWLSTLALQADTDTFQPQSQKVGLMTMHAAKGLEFPVVFIAGCEDELIPFRHKGEKTGNTDEERRLFYVAMTRAKGQLYMTWADQRRIYGKRVSRTISPYIGAIDNGLLEEQQTTKRTTKPKPIQQSLFDL